MQIGFDENTVVVSGEAGGGNEIDGVGHGDWGRGSWEVVTWLILYSKFRS